ncbi:MAG: AzlD domain-containing protein [Ruminococcus sp.]|nr:AzlD domain-containing protein [Ruminococcus sp.]
MTARLLCYILVMAGVTYLVRMLPLMVFRRKIKSRFAQSFLYYVPYAVLGAMTIPAVFYATGHTISAAVGLAAAFVLAFFGRSLIVVALTASGAAFIAELFIV